MQDVAGDGRGGQRHNAEVDEQLLRQQRFLEMAQQQEVIQVKVDAEQQHEDADDPFGIGAVVRPDAERPAAEAAGTG